MRGEVGLPQIKEVIARAGGCGAGACPDSACLCRVQALALMEGYRVIQRGVPRMNLSHHYTSEEVDRLVAAHGRGDLEKDIAEALGRSSSSIRHKVYALQSAGVLQRRRNTEQTMTQKQKVILDIIKAFWAEHGYAPSYQVIADASGIKSKGEVFRVLGALQERGYITRLPRRARSVRVVDQEVAANGPLQNNASPA